MTETFVTETDFHACPVCGGTLQMTEVREVYFRDSIFTLVTDEHGPRIELQDDGSWWHDGDIVETRLYCENDHTTDEMLAALRGEKVLP